MNFFLIFLIQLQQIFAEEKQIFEYLFPFTLNEYGHKYYQKSFNESMDFLSSAQQEKDHCNLFKNPSCDLLAHQIQIEDTPKLYNIPEDVRDKYSKFINKHNLYQNDNVLYKVGIYQFMESFNDADFCEVMIDFDNEMEQFSFTPKQEDFNKHQKISENQFVFHEKFTIPQFININANIPVVFKNLFIPSKKLFKTHSNQIKEEELEFEIIKQILQPKQTQFINFHTQINDVSFNDFEPNGRYPQDNFIITEEEPGEIQFEIPQLMSCIFIKDLDILGFNQNRRIQFYFQDELQQEEQINSFYKRWRQIKIYKIIDKIILSSNIGIDNIIVKINKDIYRDMIKTEQFNQFQPITS